MIPSAMAVARARMAGMERENETFLQILIRRAAMADLGGGGNARIASLDHKSISVENSSNFEMEALKSKGNEAFKKGDLQLAINFYGSALELSSDNPQLLSNRCMCLLRLKKHAEALIDAERAVAASPSWAKAWARKAEALNALDRFADAEAAIKHALLLEPDNKEFAKLLAAAQPRPPPPLALPAPMQRHALLPNPGPNLLVLLHGLGDTCDNFAAFGRKMELPRTSVLSLHAPLPLMPGDLLPGEGGAWFPAFEPDGSPLAPRPGDPRRPAGLRAAAALVRRCLEEGCWASGRWRARDTFLLGFSHGAIVAAELGPPPPPAPPRPPRLHEVLNALESAGHACRKS